MAITAHSLKNYQVQISAGNHLFVSDEPLGVGDDAGPEPFDLLLASLASCTIITLHMYARRKNWPLERVDAVLDMTAVENRSPEGERQRTTRIETRLTLHGPLDPAQIQRLEEIAGRCPVHRALKGEIQIDTIAVSAGASPAAPNVVTPPPAAVE
jgi:putative redox protein